jgi:hypothetical protein
MARKPSTRGGKVGARAKTERDSQDIRRLLRAAGSRAELIRWIDQELRAPPIRGRRRNVFFNDFSITDGPAKGLYLMRFKLGGAPVVYCVIVRPKAHRVKPGGAIRTWVESKCGNDFPTPHQAIREIVRVVWDAYEKAAQDQTLSPTERKLWNTSHLGKSVGNVDDAIDTITRRVVGELRKAGKAKK